MSYLYSLYSTPQKNRKVETWNLWRTHYLYHHGNTLLSFLGIAITVGPVFLIFFTKCSPWLSTTHPACSMRNSLECAARLAYGKQKYPSLLRWPWVFLPVRAWNSHHAESRGAHLLKMAEARMTWVWLVPENVGFTSNIWPSKHVEDMGKLWSTL